MCLSVFNCQLSLALRFILPVADFADLKIQYSRQGPWLPERDNVNVNVNVNLNERQSYSDDAILSSENDPF